MKVLVVGSGGREHALAHTFFRQGHQVFSYPGNPGIHSVAPLLSKEPDLLSDFAKLAEAAKEMDLTVVGSEVHLEKGIQDFFSQRGLLLFGPSREAARIEASKAWAKSFMEKYRIPTARFEVCRTPQIARLTAKKFLSSGNGAVVKASGLAGGKGVVCCATYEEAEEAIQLIAEQKIYGSAGTELVVEELLTGPEISLMAITDGERIYPLLSAQDHKRLLDGDGGPNTGGMGAYAPVPFFDAALQRETDRTIIQPTLRGLKQEGIVYRGILYFGLMLTKEGPKVLEYNCRFGDPETQALLPLLESDLAEMMRCAAKGDLKELKIRWKTKSCCCVVLASRNYPGAGPKGEPIGNWPEKDDVHFFHAGTSLDDRGRLIASGGRVLGVTALGNDLEEAVARAYDAIDSSTVGSELQFRRDIGRAALSTAV